MSTGFFCQQRCEYCKLKSRAVEEAIRNYFFVPVQAPSMTFEQIIVGSMWGDFYFLDIVFQIIAISNH